MIADLDGTWGFVFGAQGGLGIGCLVIKDGQFHGWDSGNVKYTGTVTDDSSGRLRLKFRMDIPAGTWMVGGSEPMDIASSRDQDFTVPPMFGGGDPIDLPVRPGVVKGMFARVPDYWAPCANGFEIKPRAPGS